MNERVRKAEREAAGPGGGVPHPWLGDSSMAGRVRAHDWSATPLGPVERWPDSLRTAASLCLRSRFPTTLWWGPELTAVYNDAYASYLGPAKHPRALGRRYRDVWPELWDAVEDQFRRLFEEGRASWQEDARMTVHRNGYPEEAFFTYSLSPVTGESGDVVGALNVVVETTRQVVANRRMRALQRTSAAPAGSRDVATAGRALARELAEHPEDVPFALLYQVNGERAELLAAAHVEPGGERAPEAFDLADRGGWPMELALRTGEPVRVEDVDERFPELPGGPWPDSPRTALVAPLDRGGFRGALIAGASPRRALDREYHAFIRSLAEAIAAALADVTAQEREREARLEAEAANQAKSQFLTAMSHELRTPLNAIAGYVDLLQTGVYGALSPKQEQSLDRVDANQRHLLTLINDILLFARIEAARLDFRIDELDAAELLESLEPLVHVQAVRKGVDYGIQGCADELRVRGDRERIRQILLNLAGNAIKFTPAGGRVALSCEPSSDGEAVIFAVSDSGPGIPREYQVEIFDPFSQVERRLDSPVEGAGLGLPISRDMARAMGGDVTVESEPGEGATFYARIPRVRPEREAPG